MQVSKQSLALALFLVVLLAAVGLAASRFRPFLGRWVYVVSPNEFVEYSITGEYVTGEGSGEMRGKWREVAPHTLSTNLDGDPPSKSYWRMSPDGEHLIITEADGTSKTLRRE